MANEAKQTVIHDNPAEALAFARELVASIEEGEKDEANSILNKLTAQRDGDMFQNLGELTRNLHEALHNIYLDDRIVAIAQEEMPNAQERLDYVITMTDRAAHRTLNAVEEGLPLSNQLRQRSEELTKRWQRFCNRQMDVEEFKTFSAEVGEFLGITHSHATSLHEQLSEVLVAQDYQDLTGQVIKQIISLAKEIEDALVGMIRAGGARQDDPEQAKKERDAKWGDGEHLAGPVPGKEHIASAVSDQNDVDELLSSLGF
ncbi:MAG TPA: protein phosphatase CheZ [Acidiferrobacteraceae bacterium]|nr:protein phosphatase CheZ [Acidiferrobacteraceae bacterium]